VGDVLCSLLTRGTVVDLISGLCIVNEGPCCSWLFNHLKTKRRLFYLKTQSVPRRKHFSYRLQKPISSVVWGQKPLFILR